MDRLYVVNDYIGWVLLFEYYVVYNNWFNIFILFDDIFNIVFSSGVFYVLCDDNISFLYMCLNFFLGRVL